MNILSAVATFYREGGPFMHVVLVLGVVIGAIVIERMIVIGRATSVDGRKFTDDLVGHASRGDTTAARQLAMMAATPVARVAQAMLQSGSQDEETLQSAADDAATLALPDLSRRLPALGVLANSCTLIGLLGTITGLITAISGVGVADAAKRSAYLASGISEALHTTAFALMIAIPTLMIQGWLGSRVEGVTEQIDAVTIRLTRALNRSHGAAASPAAPRPVVAAPAAASRVAPAAAQAGGR